MCHLSQIELGGVLANTKVGIRGPTHHPAALRVTYVTV